MERINKAMAAKLFVHGADIYLCRATLNPCNIWEPAQRYNAADLELSFDMLVNAFTYYNGRPAYYITED